MIGIQSKTKEGILGTFAGHQTVGNLIIFALLKDRTEGKELLLSETSSNVRRGENNDADTSGQMSLKCTVKDSETKENALHQVANSISCPRFIFNSGCQDQVSVEVDN